jgi:glycosyltransferase involved in cell wall biosynthesis
MHGPEEFDSPRGWSLRDKIHLAQFVVAVSEFTRSQLLRWSNYQDWSKIHVVRLGVSPLFLEHGPAPIPDSNRFVNIGRVVEQKGHAILIQAVARLRDQGIPCQLTIVGDGNMRPEIERLIRHFQLEDSVRITGFLSNQDVRNQLLAARALVLPSFAEGLPVVMFEALALGRPVITTYIAGHPELIENGVNGWLVPAGAVDPLVHAMAQALAAEPATLELMGRAGAASVAERHNPAIEVPKLLNLFTSRGQSTLPSQAIPLPRTIEPSQSAAPELRPKMASR